MDQTNFKELEAKFVKDRLERGRVDRAIRKVLRAGKLHNNEGAAMGCVYAALMNGDTDNLPDAVSKALSDLLPEDYSKVVSKLKTRFDTAELQASILFGLGMSEDYRQRSTPAMSDFSRIAADILKPETDDYVLNIGGGKTFMEAAFTAQPHIIYSEWDSSSYLCAMEALRASLLDFQEVRFPSALSYGTHSKAFVAPYEDWGNTKIGEYASPLFEGTEVSEASRGWNKIAEAVRALRQDGMLVAALPADVLISPREVEIRRFFTNRQLLRMVVVLPHSMTSPTPFGCLLVLGNNRDGVVRFVNALEIAGTEDEWTEALLKAIHSPEYAADVPTDKIRKEDFDWFPVKYVLSQHYNNIVTLRDVTKSVLRGSQIRRDVLEDYESEKTTDIRCITRQKLVDGILLPENLTNICLSCLPESLTAHTVPNRAIVLSKLSGYLSSVVEKENGITLVALDNLYVIEVDEEKIDPYYLQAYIAVGSGGAALRSVSSGTVIPNLSQTNLLKLPVPILPMEKQKEIGNRYREIAHKRLDLLNQAELQEKEMKGIWGSFAQEEK